ncbi:hypothetical protein OHA72_11035 [Dactylosporangium sp. NBC_01737]|uniref:hypothetical protein n=1 Tax=Dactylosporangium sp. NBC_01737 TaxID=2975959 RepID=UPI002E15B935|nr:hypothetical protein OHA72_11035 [Dactylosporangium sp. NBC_01737]
MSAHHTPRHRQASRASTALRKVRWLRLLHPRPSTTVTLDLDTACALPAPPATP